MTFHLKSEQAFILPAIIRVFHRVIPALLSVIPAQAGIQRRYKNCLRSYADVSQLKT